MSLPLRECGLKFETVGSYKDVRGHSPCGSVDWNKDGEMTLSELRRHSPCGSVDWNRKEI